MHKNGTLTDVVITLSPVRGAAGPIGEVSRIVSDLTRRRHLETQLNIAAEELATLQAFLNSVAEGAVATAEALTRVLARPITYDPVSIDERRAALEATGLASWRVELLLGLDEINRTSLYATTTDTVQALTGHPPGTIEDYIERNRRAFS